MPANDTNASPRVGSFHPTDPFLHAAVDALHDSPMQQKFRAIRPWPVGVVFIEHPGMTEDDIRGHFRLMRELGFTALKQCQTCRGTDNKKVMHMALDAGIIPWWFGEAGWETPTPELLDELGIDRDITPEALRENEAWLSRQERVMRDRIDERGSGRTTLKPKANTGDAAKLAERAAVDVPGVQPRFDYGIPDDHRDYFIAWLKNQYGTIDGLNRAWNLHHCMIGGPKSQPDHNLSGDDPPAGWTSWEHLASEVCEVVNHERREYRRIRDVLRYHADNYLEWLRQRVDASLEADPNAPVRAGGEMGLFLPFASRGTDMEGIAELMRERGSFYPSFHLAWHFEETGFETVRPMYMQSSITTDWFKGGWNATWESTGGPQQMTGHKAPFVPKVRDKVPGFTVDAGVMTQLMLSWIAGGYRGFGIWCWSVRTAGWEGGEFGLLDRNNRPTDRAVLAGKIGQACRCLRDELWQARKEPVVGIFQDWDMEAIWAASSLGGRDLFKTQPINARIGAARAMINGNVPFEHVTASDLRHGLAARYRTILLPAALALDPKLIEEQLIPYVEAGGRVILDAPGAWFDTFGQLLSTDDGSPFERLFGTRIADYQYSRPGNRVWSVDGLAMEGCTFDLQPTRAEVAASFDHRTTEQPRPAITRNKLGAGEAIVLGFEATLMCKAAGSESIEALLRKYATAEIDLPYACDEALVYRLATPQADHYFLLNDGEAVNAKLRAPGFSYARAEDPITGEAIDLTKPIAIASHSGRWVRAVRGERS